MIQILIQIKHFNLYPIMFVLLFDWQIEMSTFRTFLVIAVLISHVLCECVMTSPGIVTGIPPVAPVVPNKNPIIVTIYYFLFTQS
jgi:hypothetical protein